MLDILFLSVLNMSITAALAIVVVLIVRLFLKKAPKFCSYALWAVVLFRLLCSFSFESKISLLPISKTPIPQDIVYRAEPKINTGFHFVDQAVNSLLPTPNMGASVNPLQVWVFVGGVIWAIGIVFMLIYSMIQYVKLKRKLIGSAPMRNHIYLADHINSPFVMGLINPRIYLPSPMTAAEQAFIIAHEQYHIKRLDHITRILAFIALTIHWFNPLVWLAFILSEKDMEMSCDEAVMKKMKIDIRAEYSRSLLRFATDRKVISATPLTFGEGDTKNRVKNVMEYKRPMLWVSIIAVIVVISVAVGLINSPKSKIGLSPMNSKDFAIEKLWTHRTKYIGDNSAVGNIVSSLSFPDDITYHGIQLYTDAAPYVMDVNLKTDTKTRNYYTEESHREQFKNNALIMFSLIGNVEHITFRLDDGAPLPLTLEYTASQAKDVLGETYFSKTKTLEGFKAVLSQLLGTDFLDMDYF